MADIAQQSLFDDDDEEEVKTDPGIVITKPTGFTGPGGPASPGNQGQSHCPVGPPGIPGLPGIVSTSPPAGQSVFVSGVGYIGIDMGKLPSWSEMELPKQTVDKVEGYNCVMCNDFAHFSEPNQPDGTFICYGCRK